jgi:isopenicillin N synthase-like dioxygenase
MEIWTNKLFKSTPHRSRSPLHGSSMKVYFVQSSLDGHEPAPKSPLHRILLYSKLYIFLCP